jgi:hypothetical protein
MLPQPATSDDQLSVFISYAREDEKLCERLIAHLSSLVNEGVISHWYDGKIVAGELWDSTIQTQLTSAKLILLLVSADFLASDYVKRVELPTATARHEAGEAWTIPIILSPCDWQSGYLKDFEALPKQAKPITTWKNRNEAFLSVIEGIRAAIERMSVLPLPGPVNRGRVRVEQRQTVGRPGIYRFLLDRYLPSLHRFLTNLGTLSKAPETDVLNNYLREARANIQNDIRHKTYIPLAGKEVASTPLQDEPSTDPFVPPMQRAIRQVVGRERGGDSASAQIAAVNRNSRVIRNIIHTLLHSSDPLVLLGDPGTGKTMTLQQAALLLMESEIKRVFPIITLYVRLGEFYVDNRVTQEDVWTYVKASVAPEISPYLEDLDSSGRLIVLFDGMDEMSRERYSEHTEALSIFAAAREGRTKTLFSCRITDFSPKFIHRRLVLLPFNDDQIGEYLRRYIPSFPLRIEDRLWTLKQLVRELLRGSLPLEATNPFVLWLLCFQLQQKGSWPSSRVELLRFYIEENYRRKSEDRADEELPFPPVDRALTGWSRFAYTITNQNRGAAIAVSALATENGFDVEEMIRVGKRCGVLQESLNEEERQIRFDHHRFQEFFTALFINQRQTEIAWLDKLDAPRWQETMVNLILMGGGDDAIRTLAEAIKDKVDPPQTSVLPPNKALNSEDHRDEKEVLHEEDDDLELKVEGEEEIEFEDDEEIEFEDDEEIEFEDDEVNDELEPNIIFKPEFSPQNETMVADRIELASRIVRQASSSSPLVATTLTETFENAVKFLSEHGNPITQVKMMRACQNVPQVDIFEILQSSLKSPINWVRNQALIIVSSSNRGPLAVGSHFASELGYDLASGTLPLRVKAYIKAAAASKQMRNWWCLSASIVAFLLNVTLLLSFAGLLFFGAWAILTGPKLSYSIDLRIFSAACVLLMIAAIGISLKFDQRRLWMAILGTGGGGFALALFILSSKQGFWGIVTFLGMSWFSGALLVGLIGAPVALAMHSFALAMYLVATAAVRHSAGTLRSYFGAMWRNCGFDKSFSFALQFGGAPIAGIVGMGVLFLLASGAHLLSKWIGLPFSGPVNILIVAVAVTLVIVIAIALKRRNLGFIPEALLTLVGIVGVFAVGIGGVVVIGNIVTWLSQKLGRLTLPITQHFTDILVVIILVLLVGALIFTLWLFRRNLQVLLALLAIRRVSRIGPLLSPEDWKYQLNDADAYQQQKLLIETNHQTLGIKPDQFLIVLTEAASSIKEEPALSTYWEKRDRLEQVLRQERLG